MIEPRLRRAELLDVLRAVFDVATGIGLARAVHIASGPPRH